MSDKVTVKLYSDTADFRVLHKQRHDDFRLGKGNM